MFHAALDLPTPPEGAQGTTVVPGLGVTTEQLGSLLQELGDDTQIHCVESVEVAASRTQ